MKKQIFFLICIISLFFLNKQTHAFFAGCTEIIRPTPEKQWQCEYLDKIIVHHGPGIACYKKNQEQGENDIRELAMEKSTQNIEEAWIYIHNKELWIDIGRAVITEGLVVKAGDEYEITQEEGKRKSKNGTAISIDVDGIYNDFTEPGDEITFYHVHPEIVSTFRSFCRKIIYKPIEEHQVLGNFPNGPDIKVAFDLKKDLNDKNVLVNPAIIIGKFYTVSYEAEKLPQKASELQQIMRKAHHFSSVSSTPAPPRTTYLELLQTMINNLKINSIEIELLDLHYPEIFYKIVLTQEEKAQIRDYLQCE